MYAIKAPKTLKNPRKIVERSIRQRERGKKSGRAALCCCCYRHRTTSATATATAIEIATHTCILPTDHLAAHAVFHLQLEDPANTNDKDKTNSHKTTSGFAETPDRRRTAALRYISQSVDISINQSMVPSHNSPSQASPQPPHTHSQLLRYSTPGEGWQWSVKSIICPLLDPDPRPHPIHTPPPPPPTPSPLWPRNPAPCLSPLLFAPSRRFSLSPL